MYAPARISATLALAALCATSVASEPVRFSPEEVRRILQHSPVPPPPPDPTNAFADDPRAAHFGQYLFFDLRLSANGAISCATCHVPARAFADGKPLAEALGMGERHTPALWNVAQQRWFFWDGRTDSLWSQARHPIESPVEMGLSRVALLHVLSRHADLRRGYETIFGPLPDAARYPAGARPMPDEPSHAENLAWESLPPADRDAVDRVLANIGKALAAYQRRLISVDSPFDRFARALRDEDPAGIAALPPAAQRGLQMFIGRGQCRFCHSGPLFTDFEFHSALMKPLDGGAPRDPGRYRGLELLKADPFNAAGSFSDAPDGAAAKRLRFAAHRADQWGQFRTPSLRNVALTAPYMHQGQLATLADVVEHYSTLRDAVAMSHHKRESIPAPLNLTAQEAADLRAFLESLTDDALPPALRTRPSGPLPE